jgi:hypothetical protein
MWYLGRCGKGEFRLCSSRSDKVRPLSVVDIVLKDEILDVVDHSAEGHLEGI